MLGLGAKGHTAQNLLREKEAVLNLPSAGMAASVNKLAKLMDPIQFHLTKRPWVIGTRSRSSR